MLIEFNGYDEMYDDNFLPEMVNDLILTLGNCDWSKIILTTHDNYGTTINNSEDYELYFEEDYIKYVTLDNIIYLEYMSICKIIVERNKISSYSQNDEKQDFKEEVDYNSWTGNRIIF